MIKNLDRGSFLAQRSRPNDPLKLAERQLTNEMVDSLIQYECVERGGLLWCILIGIYKKLNSEQKVLEIIYCKPEVKYCGTDEDDVKFMENMPWLSLPPDNQRFFSIS